MLSPSQQLREKIREKMTAKMWFAGGANPPVCRLLNHSQVSFEAKVKERKLEKLKLENRRVSTIKEVSCGTLHIRGC